MCNLKMSQSMNVQLINTKTKSFICNICNKGFSSKSRLDRHTCNTEEKPHICKVCNRGFASKYNLGMHAFVHTGEKPHICEVCNKGFSRKDRLNKHLFVKHSLIHTKKEPRSMVQNKSSSSKSRLDSHLLVQTEEKPHICEICNRGFSILERSNSTVRYDEDLSMSVLKNRTNVTAINDVL